MTNTHEKIVEHLRANRVPFEVVDHAPAASAQEYQQVLKTRLEQQAKALLVQATKRGQADVHAVVAVPAQKRADLKRVAAALEADNARLADASALERLTGCKFGELPPLGKLFGLPLLVDRELFTQDRIYFNAGALTKSIVLAPDQLRVADSPIEI